jgi:FAD synthase
VILEFIEHIRDEIRFSSVEELSAQIARDCERARQIVEGRP